MRPAPLPQRTSVGTRSGQAGSRPGRDSLGGALPLLLSGPAPLQGTPSV